MTTEREETIKYLVDYGLDRPEAELIARDEDLWILDPYMHIAIEDKEAVGEWEQAHEFFSDLAEMALSNNKTFNQAIRHTLLDAAVRSKEALRRAKERVREAS
jgi:hypothetical protein